MTTENIMEPAVFNEENSPAEEVTPSFEDAANRWREAYEAKVNELLDADNANIAMKSTIEQRDMVIGELNKGNQELAGDVNNIRVENIKVGSQYQGYRQAIIDIAGNFGHFIGGHKQ